MTDAVISAAFGYQAIDIAPFVRSLRAVYSDEIVLIIRPDQIEDYKGVLDSYGIRIAAVNLLNQYKPHVARFQAYQSILEKQRNHYARIMLSDSRDVLFQKNPFQVSGEFLNLYAEPCKIGMCSMNSNWIKKYYNNDFFESVKNELIICSGTTIGSMDLILNYVSKMLMEIRSAFAKYPANVVWEDQAFHNYLYYSGKLPFARICKHGFSDVQTLHYEQRLWFDRNGYLLNYDGQIVPVLHQYDRHKIFSNLFNKLGV